jgi:hypothetical protein
MIFSLLIFQLSKDLNALVVNRHPYKHKPPKAKFFQPGEPENEAEIYKSKIKPRTRRTLYTTQSTSIQTPTQLPLTTLLFTTETTTTTTTMTSTVTTISTTTTNTSPLASTLMTTVITQTGTTIHSHPQARVSGQRRRSNMTLYILTSDEHKIRQFSVNHTRGILINCNQLRRRLLGRRRRLRDTLQTTITAHNSINIKNSSIQTFQYNILLLTILLFFFLQK